MTGKLTTHVLDTAKGKPAAGMRIELHRLERGEKIPIADCITNADGRTAEPLLSGETMAVGKYRLLFHVAEYFAAHGSPDAGNFSMWCPCFFELMTQRRHIMCRCWCRLGRIRRIGEVEGNAE